MAQSVIVSIRPSDFVILTRVMNCGFSPPLSMRLIVAAETLLCCASSSTDTEFGEPKESPEPGKEMKRAMDFLDEILANGPVNQSVIKQKAEEAEISTTTLNRAKQRCGRGSKRISKELTV